MDSIDKTILHILAKNAHATATEISSAVNLSIPAVNKRIQKLRTDGVIRSFTVLTDSAKVGKPVTAYILVVVRYEDGIDELMALVENDRDVLECYALAGEYDYLLKVCADDVDTLQKKLLSIKAKRSVVKSHTMLSLQELKFRPTALPDREE